MTSNPAPVTAPRAATTKFLQNREHQQLIGQSPASIRVRNLQTHLKIGKDAWGRSGKDQPVLISASIFLRHAFESASSQDAVTKSTVHYGTLSKGIFEACAVFSEKVKGDDVHDLLGVIEGYLTHLGLYSFLAKGEPLLTPEVMTALEVTVMLPKASLIGSGVSITRMTSYDPSLNGALAKSHVISLHDLRIPCVIGVNPNERLAKQIVIANITLDPCEPCMERYNELEQIVFKTIEESSFQTLEALATHLGQRVISCFIIPGTHSANDIQTYPEIRITLEKPTAVTFADAPMIELFVSSKPGDSEEMKTAWRGKEGLKVVPFPLQGALGEWVVAGRGLA